MTTVKPIRPPFASGMPAGEIRPTRGGYIPREFATFKAALDQTISDCGGYDAAANHIGKSSSSVNDWTNPYKRVKPEMHEVVALVRLSGSTALAEYFARECGRCDIVPRAGSNASVHALLARVSREVGEVHALYAEAMADGELCGDDRIALLKEVSEARAELGRMEAELKRLLPGVA